MDSRSRLSELPRTLYAIGPGHVCQRRSEEGPGEHRDGCEPVPERSRRACARKSIVAAESSAIDRRFGDGFLQTWTLGFERTIFGDLPPMRDTWERSPSVCRAAAYPNGYPGAEPGFAPYTTFDTAGAVTGGFGIENGDHRYGSLLLSRAANLALRNVGHGGPGLQAGYTWSKSSGRHQLGDRRNRIHRRRRSTDSAGSLRYASGERPIEL